MAKRVGRLAAICIGHLATLPARAPLQNESEPSFSSAVLGPAIIDFIRKLELPGLHVGGDGAGPTSTVPFLGCMLRPDVTILSFSKRLLAVEVKVLRANSMSSDVTKATGQAALYRAAGFDYTAMFLIDRARNLNTAEVASARSLLKRIGVDLVVRQQLENRLTIDESCPYLGVTSSS